MNTIPIHDVIIGERARKDLGDLTDLKRSIDDVGLLQPIVLAPDNHLLCGARRLQACTELGMTNIPFTRADTCDDAGALLTAERDENICRKQMTPEELATLGQRLEALEAPRARQRQRAAGKRHGRGQNSSCSSEQRLSVGDDTTLTVVTAAWQRDADSSNAHIFGGVGLLVHRYRGEGVEVDLGRLAVKMSQQRPVDVVSKGKLIRGGQGGTMAAGVAKHLVGLYNAKLTTNRLPEWNWTRQ